MNRAFSLAALLGCVAALAVGRVEAQAWTPPRGEGAVSISYQNFDATGHFESNGDRIALGGSQSQALRLDLDYALTDRLALVAGVPYVAVRNGRDGSPVLGRTGIDDGHYHGALQDLRIGLRYALREDAIAAALFLEQIIPTRDYETVGEAAPGRGLDETLIGVNIGSRLGNAAYAHLRYGHAFVENVHDISTDRDNLDLEVGYALTARFTLRALGTWQDTHGGLNFPADVIGPDRHDLFVEHDRLLDDDHIKAGIGARITLTRALDGYGFYLRTIEGSNTHSGSGFGVGVAWLFGARQ